MPTKLSENAKQLIDRPNFAHLATLMPDGSPHSTPIWVGREDDQIVICTSEGSLKARNTKRDPRVALSIVDFGVVAFVRMVDGSFERRESLQTMATDTFLDTVKTGHCDPPPSG